jgi:membrane-associated protein
MIWLGYSLTSVLDPLLSWLFGRKIEVAKNIDIVIVVIVLISVLPIMIKGVKGYLAKRKAARLPATPVA